MSDIGYDPPLDGDHHFSEYDQHVHYLEAQLTAAQAEVAELRKRLDWLGETPISESGRYPNAYVQGLLGEIEQLRKDKERLDAGDDLHAAWYFDNARYDGTLRECLDQHMESEARHD